MAMRTTGNDRAPCGTRARVLASRHDPFDSFSSRFYDPVRKLFLVIGAG